MAKCIISQIHHFGGFFASLQNFSLFLFCVYMCIYIYISGWRISDESVCAGLELTYLPGRSQILTSKEADALGLPGATILLDGGLLVKSLLLLFFTSIFTQLQLL